MSEPECFFAYLGKCQPQTMVKAHLVPKNRLAQELRTRLSYDGLDAAIWDTRAWRWMCGGISKINGCHGAYDAYQIRLHAWPEDFLRFLCEYDIEWMAEKYATESTRRA
jgi:hypothetical protein